MERIEYEEAGHRYWAVDAEGRRRFLPGVTHIIAAAGLLDTSHFRPWHAERGRMAHLAIALEAQGLLIESSVDERLRGYLDAWRRWRQIIGPHRIVRLEYTVGDPSLAGGFAGRADMEIEFAGDLWVVDTKTGGAADWHELQVGGYLRGHLDGPPRQGGRLYLGKDGRPSFRPLDATRRLYAIGQFEGLVGQYHAIPRRLF